MPTERETTRDQKDHRRGLITLAVAVAVIAVGMTAGVTGDGPSAASGAATWVARERPAGPVLTIDGWGSAVADGDRLRVLTANGDELMGLAVSADPGSVVVPSDATWVADLQRTGEWTVTYRDDRATVLVRDGALPVPGAT